MRRRNRGRRDRRSREGKMRGEGYYWRIDQERKGEKMKEEKGGNKRRGNRR